MKCMVLIGKFLHKTRIKTRIPVCFLIGLSMKMKMKMSRSEVLFAPILYIKEKTTQKHQICTKHATVIIAVSLLCQDFLIFL